MHKSSGLIEQKIKSIEEITSKYLLPDQSNWDILLPFVIYNLNCNINVNTKYSPYEIVFGFYSIQIIVR